MPIIKSAIKRMKQTATRRARNVRVKRELRAALKDFHAALTTAADSKKAQDLQKALDKAYGALDIAVKKNVLHKNTAARKKAQLSAKAKDAGHKTAAKKPTTPAKKATATKTTTAKAAAPAKKAPAKNTASKPAATKAATKKSEK